jgi:hypothetical protein
VGIAQVLSPKIQPAGTERTATVRPTGTARALISVRRALGDGRSAATGIPVQDADGIKGSLSPGLNLADLRARWCLPRGAEVGGRRAR